MKPSHLSVFPNTVTSFYCFRNQSSLWQLHSMGLPFVILLHTHTRIQIHILTYIHIYIYIYIYTHIHTSMCACARVSSTPGCVGLSPPIKKQDCERCRSTHQNTSHHSLGIWSQTLKLVTTSINPTMFDCTIPYHVRRLQQHNYSTNYHAPPPPATSCC